MQMPARGFAAFGVAIRLDSLLLSAVAQPLAALLPYGCRVPLAGKYTTRLASVEFLSLWDKNYARSRSAIPVAQKASAFWAVFRPERWLRAVFCLLCFWVKSVTIVCNYRHLAYPRSTRSV